MKKTAGFTLIELLVATGVFAVLVGLTARPISEVVASVLNTRRTSEAASRNLAFIDILGADIRSASRVEEATSHKLVIANSTGDSIIWIFEDHSARRNTTSLPWTTKNLVLATDRPPPMTRHILIRVDLAGIGKIEQGYTLRREGP